MENDPTPADQTSQPIIQETKPYKKPLFIVLAAILVLGLGLYYFADKHNTPTPTISGYTIEADKLFKQMIEESLSVRSMTEHRIVTDSSGEQLLDQLITYDVSDPKHARIYSVAKGTLSSYDLNSVLEVEYISVPEGNYRSFKKMNGKSPKNPDQWVSITEGGVVNKDGLALTLGHESEELQNSFMGFYIPANYDRASKETVQRYILDKTLYEWFSDGVKHHVNGNEDYYTFEVGISNAKHDTYNLLVAQLLGLELSKEPGGVNGKTVFTIDTKTKRLTKVEIQHDNGLLTIINYYDYNKPTNIKKPAQIADAAQFRKDTADILRTDSDETRLARCKASAGNAAIPLPGKLTVTTKGPTTLHDIQQFAGEYAVVKPLNEVAGKATQFTVSNAFNKEQALLSATSSYPMFNIKEVREVTTTCEKFLGFSR